MPWRKLDLSRDVKNHEIIACSSAVKNEQLLGISFTLAEFKMYYTETNG